MILKNCPMLLHCAVLVQMHALLKFHYISSFIAIVRSLLKMRARHLSLKSFNEGIWSRGFLPTLYKMATKMVAPAMSPFIKNKTISNGPGPLKAWTEARDFLHQVKTALETG